jgi:predicted component of type VI protein secretion system
MNNRIFHISNPQTDWPFIPSDDPFVSLEITKGTTRRRVRLIDTPVFMIGSDRDCDLMLGDPQFPEVYAYLFIRNGQVSIRRLGDGPDMSIDGHITDAGPLADGDCIRTGPFEFRVNIQRRPTTVEAAVIPLPAGRSIDRAVLLSVLEAQGVLWD